MKKIFLNILFFTLLTVSAAFASDVSDNGNIRLPEIITTDRGYYTKYEYDAQNRITKISSFLNDGTFMETTTLVYSGNNLVKAGESGFSVNGNKITANSDAMELNNDEYLAKLTYLWENYTVEQSYQYQGGNIKNRSEKYAEIWDGKRLEGTVLEHEYIYDNNKSPFVHCKTPKWYMVRWHQPFSGQNNCVEKRTIDKTSGGNNYSGKSAYIYVFDDAGYPIKRTTKFFDNGGKEYLPEEDTGEAVVVEFKYMERNTIEKGSAELSGRSDDGQSSNDRGNVTPPTPDDGTKNTVPEQKTAVQGELSFNFAGYKDLTKEEHGKIQMNVILRKTTVVKKTNKDGKTYDSKEYENQIIASGTLQEGFSINIKDPKSDQYEVIIKVKEDRILAGLAGAVTGSTKVGDAIVKDLRIELKSVMYKTDFDIAANKSVNNKGVTTYNFVVK